MSDLKSIIAKNMRMISWIMVFIILLLSLVIQTYDLHATARRDAARIFGQVELYPTKIQLHLGGTQQ